MGIRLRKNAVDLGIVAKDGSTMLSFYRDLLGFRHKGDIPFPMGVLCTGFGAGTV